MDHSRLIPALSRLMAEDETTFSPADAILLRDALPVQSLISWNLNMSGPQRQRNKGPVKVWRYHLLHTCQLITNNSVISISLEPEDLRSQEGWRSVRVPFEKDTPISLDRYGVSPIGFSLGPIGVILNVPIWITWKTPDVPPSPSAQTSEHPAP